MTLRIPDASDFPGIARFARSSFHVPRGWYRHRCNRCHYDPAWLASHRHLHLSVILCEGPNGRLCGYAYYQLRPDGDVYLKELAANPPDRSEIRCVRPGHFCFNMSSRKHSTRDAGDGRPRTCSPNSGRPGRVVKLRSIAIRLDSTRGSASLTSTRPGTPSPVTRDTRKTPGWQPIYKKRITSR